MCNLTKALVLIAPVRHCSFPVERLPWGERDIWRASEVGSEVVMRVGHEGRRVSPMWLYERPVVFGLWVEYQRIAVSRPALPFLVFSVTPRSTYVMKKGLMSDSVAGVS